MNCALVVIGRLELGGVADFELHQLELAFMADDHAAGVECGLKRVLAGRGLAFFSARPGAELGVAGVGLELFFGCHKWKGQPVRCRRAAPWNSFTRPE